MAVQVENVQLLSVTGPAVADARYIKQIWIAVAPRDTAINLVEALVPAGWRAELLVWKLTEQHLELLDLQPGDVCELYAARRRGEELQLRVTT